MTRNQTILAGLLAFQLLLIFLVRSPFASTTGADGSRVLLPELEELTATKLEFEGDEDKRLTLEQREGEWVIDEIGGYPADATKIDDLLDKFEGLKVRRPVVSGSRYHKAFEIADDENRGRVRVFGESGDSPAVDLILGNSPNYRVLHVRRAEKEAVYEVQGLAAYDVSADPGFWAQKQLVDVPEGELVGIKLTNASGTIELAKDGETWQATAPDAIAGASLNADEVDALLRAARTIRIDKPVGRVDDAAQGFAEPVATVELRWRPGTAEDATAGDDAGEGAEAGEGEGESTAAAAPGPVQTLTFSVGATVPDKETQRYVTRGGFGFAGTIWVSSIQKLLDETPDALVDIGESDPGESDPGESGS